MRGGNTPPIRNKELAALLKCERFGFSNNFGENGSSYSELEHRLNLINDPSDSETNSLTLKLKEKMKRNLRYRNPTKYRPFSL